MPGIMSENQEKYHGSQQNVRKARKSISEGRKVLEKPEISEESQE